MNLFDLPNELVLLIFDHLPTSRNFTRLMRTRLVNRKFRDHVDGVVFRLRLLSDLLGFPWWVERVLRYRHVGWVGYVDAYLAYQVSREQSSETRLGQIGRVALALCEGDGRAVEMDVSACIDILVRLAAHRNAADMLGKPNDAKSDYRGSAFEADLFVAAVYMGCEAYVGRLVMAGAKILGTVAGPYVHSKLFGVASRAATLQGHVGIMKLFLLTAANDPGSGLLLRPSKQVILRDSATYGHRAAYDFALDILARDSRYAADGFESIVNITPWPDAYERAANLLEPEPRLETRRHQRSAIVGFHVSITRGHVEMVRYFLERGVNPDPEPEHWGTYNPYGHIAPLHAAVRCHNAEITRLLLDAGADPNWFPSHATVLRVAAWARNASIAKLLLERGADVNAGFPPPIVIAALKEDVAMFRLLREHGAKLDTPETGAWAMGLVRFHGLDSMADLLVDQGVGRNLAFHHVATEKEFKSDCYSKLWR
ncbi:hypothetical protein SCUP234_13114 [Seiridium cupressi]